MSQYIEIDDRAVQAAIRRVEAFFKDMRPFYEDIGAALERSTDKRFAQERDAQGQDWPDLAPSTWCVKKNRKMLNESGQLRGSLSYRADKDEVVVGYSDRKARWLMLGTDPYTIRPKRPGGKLAFVGDGCDPVFAREVRHPGLPARNPLGISKEDAEEIAEIAEDHVGYRWSGGLTFSPS